MVREACGAHDVIVAAGGDGTIRRAATAIGSSGLPLGLLPMGTGNVFAREIGLRRDPVQIADTILDGATKAVHGAYANGEPFYLMAGAGFDARVIRSLNQPLKRIVGRAAYAPAILGSLQQPVECLDITIDGRRHEANWAIVANARHYGGGFVIAPEASLFHPGLEIILISAQSRSALVGQLLKIAAGKLVQSANTAVKVLKGSHIVIERRKPHHSGAAVPIQVDGDAFGTLPLRIDANGPQLRLIVPD
jgi:diacylglycerol kinase (ATP)